MFRAGLFALVAAIALVTGGPAVAEKRVALVIGNSAYKNVSPLVNPKPDAMMMAKTLGDLGFTLVGDGPALDLTKPDLDRVVQQFGQQAQGADVALFYYAGHGVQVRGANFLVPVSANATREADIDFHMLDVNIVLRQMQAASTKLNIVILDACRNNPFGGAGTRSGEGGLAQMRAPEGTLISYATQPGSVALDGDDGNSPYTRALSATLGQGLDLFQTFNQVGLAVKRATGGQQQPWVSSSPIDGVFYFAQPKTPGTQTAAVQDTPPVRAPAADPFRIPLQSNAQLAELSDRLYERNFDTESPDGKRNIRVAITQFQERIGLSPNGEATEGVLARLRSLDDLKPWGSIVYGPDTNKWGMAWDHGTRKKSVEDARAQCGAGQCPIELSFYGGSCGAFAISDRSWSLVQRDSVRAAQTAALDECGKAGKSCRIIGAVCANGSGRSPSVAR